MFNNLFHDQKVVLFYNWVNIIERIIICDDGWSYYLKDQSWWVYYGNKKKKIYPHLVNISAQICIQSCSKDASPISLQMICASQAVIYLFKVKEKKWSNDIGKPWKISREEFFIRLGLTMTWKIILHILFFRIFDNSSIFFRWLWTRFCLRKDNFLEKLDLLKKVNFCFLDKNVL